MSTHGYPDYQRYAQWFGAPLVDAAAFPIGAGSHTDANLGVNNWSSVILYIKPTGGAITATIRQTSSGIASGLVSDTVITVAAGSTRVQSVVLLGNNVSLILQGSAPGETVDYSLVPSNTAVNTGTVTNPTIGFQHNGALVGNEPTVDFEDGGLGFWTVTDDGPGTRVQVTPLYPPGLRLGGTLALVDVQNTLVETDLLGAAGVVVPAGAMGTARSVWLRLYGDVLFNRNTADTYRLRIYFGGAVIWDGGGNGMSALSAIRHPWTLDAQLTNTGVANDQALDGTTWMGYVAGPSAGIAGGTPGGGGNNALFGFDGIEAVAAVNTNLAQTVRVTEQWNVASALDSFRVRQAHLYLM